MFDTLVLVIAFLCYAALSFLRPRFTLGVLLLLIPFGHLVRFSVAGVPFTFVEAAVYVLAIAIGLQTAVYRLRLPTPSRSPSRREGEKKNSFPTSHREGGRRGGGGLTPYALRLTSRLRDPWLLLPLLWVLVAVVAAVGSPAGVRAWGIWKAYVLAPVLLFWVIRHVFQRTPVSSSVGSGISNDEFLISKKIPNTNDQTRAERDPSSLQAPQDDATRHFLLPIAFSAFLVAAIAIIQRWWPIGVPYPWSLPGKFRATSVFGYPNAVGLYLAPLVPLLIGFACARWRSPTPSRSPSQGEGEKKNISPPPSGRGGAGGWGVRIVFITIALLSLLAIILARSTGALVALAAVFPVFLFSTWRAGPQRGNSTHFGDRRNGWDARRGNRRAVGIVLVWVLTSLLLTTWLPYRHEQPRWGPPIVQKLTFQKWSGSVRLAQYRETWQLLRDHPIRGAGLAGYQTAIRPYHEKQDVEIFLYPHNLLLAIWAELGLAGLLVFLAILYQFFRQLLSPPPAGRGSDLSRPERRERGWGLWSGLAAAMLVLLIHGLVDVPYFKNDLAMMFWVIVAIGVATSAGKLGDHLTAAASPPMLPSR